MKKLECEKHRSRKHHNAESETRRKASAMKRKQAQEQNWRHKNCIEAETTKTGMQTQMIYKYWCIEMHKSKEKELWKHDKT
jgi:hypothetical protein